MELWGLLVMISLSCEQKLCAFIFCFQLVKDEVDH